MQSRRRVVITGMGVITSLGETLEALWTSLLTGKSGIGKITRFDSSKFDILIGGECSHFDPTQYIEKRETKRMDRFTQFAVSAAVLAMRDSALKMDNEDPYRVGVLIGTGIGGLQEIEDQHLRLLNKGPGQVSPFTVPRLMANAASGNVSILFGARGPCSCVSTACATGANAIGDAARLIQYGEVDVMITGGTEAALTPLGVMAFAAARALSKRNDSPETASRPFDLTRDGFVMGEGAGVLVIEEYEHALKRGANIYGELLGYGCCADAGHITQPDENGTGAARSMANALQEAKLGPQDICYINAHGTSTLLGDIAETIAVKTIFGDFAKKVPISSTKSHLGHLLGAAGGVEAVICALVLKHQILPPTINLHEPDPQCDLDYVPNVPREVKCAVTMTNSFGFGGHNVSLILAKPR